MKLADDDASKAELESVLVDFYPNKFKLISVSAIDDNFKGTRQSEAANVFVGNLGVHGVKNAQISLRLFPSDKSPIKFKYADYRVRVLKLTYTTSGMAGNGTKDEIRTKERVFTLRKANNWREEGAVSFGEIVQSGGSALFGYKLLDIHLSSSELVAEVIDVKPL